MKTKKYFYFVFIFLFVLMSIDFFSAVSYGSGPYGMGAYGIGYTAETSGGGGNVSYLYRGNGIKFEFNNESYTIKLDDIINGTAVISISGIGQTFNLSVNETKKIDLDGDKVYDVQIFLEGVISSGVILDIELIQEPISSEGEEQSLSSEKRRESLYAIAFLILGLALFLLVILVTKIRKIKSKHKKSR